MPVPVCDTKVLVTAVVSAVLLLNGCSEADLDCVEVDCSGGNSTIPSLASIRLRDDPSVELRRIDCLGTFAGLSGANMPDRRWLVPFWNRTDGEQMLDGEDISCRIYPSRFP